MQPDSPLLLQIFWVMWWKIDVCFAAGKNKQANQSLVGEIKGEILKRFVKTLRLISA